MTPSKSKEKGDYTHEAYFKETVTTMDKSSDLIISAQAKSKKEALEIFKKIKEIMKK